MKTFIEKITPSAMVESFKVLCTKRPDLRVLLYMLGENRMLEWIHSVGVSEEDDLKKFIPPFPPLQLRQITASPDIPEFLWSGLMDMNTMMINYEKYSGASKTTDPVILDFGCGCGRMVRFLTEFSSKPVIHACDVNEDHTDWCRDHLPNIRVSRCEALPPLTYPDKMFNLVYGLSVFTHLSEASSVKWLHELNRILIPGGVLIVTIHGLTALSVIRNSAGHQQMFNMDVTEVDRIAGNFAETPFVFKPYAEETLKVARAGTVYGNTFIHPDYIHRNWGDAGFHIREIIPGGLRGWQDLVILQRKEV
jgi:SAM-dependent methyltransferase